MGRAQTSDTESWKMSEQPAAREFDAGIKEIGDKIAGLTLVQAKELTDYLKETYSIEPAAGGAVMMAAPTAGGEGAAAAAEEQTEFKVVIKAAGDKKLQVIKVVRAARSDLGLKEAKALVDKGPGTVLKTGLTKEEAGTLKGQLEEAGATVELK